MFGVSSCVSVGTFSVVFVVRGVVEVCVWMSVWVRGWVVECGCV